MAAGLAVPSAGAEDAVVTRAPLRLGMNIDFGQVVSGRHELINDTAKSVIVPGGRIEGQMLQRTGVSLIQSATISNRLTLTVGVGGLFWYSLPEDPNRPGSRTTKFGPGVAVTQGRYVGGDPENPSWDLQFGYFPYKYNPDSKNLGEYLLRSGTYPGYLVTGGWSVVNSSHYMAQGIRAGFNFLDGRFRNDFTLFMERDFEPIYDLSPSYLFSYDAGGILTLGGGVTFNHLIPVKPSRTTPKRNNAVWVQGPNPDTATAAAKPVVWIRDTTQFYSFKGTKVMGRLALNTQGLFDGLDFLGREDLKIYGEFAILGVKDYPYFYENILNRIPVMAGINLPTFKLLDMLSMEVEYRRWEFPNDVFMPYESTLPLWRIPGSGDPNVYEKDYASKYNLKWSVFARRALTDGLSLYAQAASDHLRSFRDDATPDRLTITRKPSDWYYLLRVEFAI